MFVIDPLVMERGEMRFFDHQEESESSTKDQFSDVSYKEYVDQKEIEERMDAIDSLDMTRIRAKLCRPVAKDGKGWDDKKSRDTEVWYKRFLKLLILHQDKMIIPINEIDDMWHYHILDTKKYHQDCHKVFGRYMHHMPFTGLEEESETKKAKEAFTTTLKLFQRHFGELPTYGLNKEVSGSYCFCNNDCGSTSCAGNE